MDIEEWRKTVLGKSVVVAEPSPRLDGRFRAVSLPTINKDEYVNLVVETHTDNASDAPGTYKMASVTLLPEHAMAIRDELMRLYPVATPPVWEPTLTHAPAPRVVELEARLSVLEHRHENLAKTVGVIDSRTMGLAVVGGGYLR